MTLDSIVAVVLGGTRLSGGQGGVAGSIIGVAILGLIRNIISFADVPTWWQTLVDALIIITALAAPGFIRLLRSRRRGMKRSLKSLKLSPPLIALLLAIGLFLLGGVLAPGFVNVSQAINIVRLAAFLGIIAAGQTLVIISGGEGIDLSIGAIVTLSAILIYRIVDGQDALVLPALAVALLAGTFFGALNGLGITALGMPPLVMTLGMAGVVQGSILVITQGTLVGRAAPIMATLISRPLVGGVPGVVIIWLLLGGLMWLLLERTTYGKNLFRRGRQPHHRAPVRRACAPHRGGHLCALRPAVGLWRLYAAGLHPERLSQPGRTLALSVGRGGGRRRHGAGRRQGQLLGHHVRRTGAHADQQSAHRGPASRSQPPNHSRRYPAGAALVLRAAAEFAAVNGRLEIERVKRSGDFGVRYLALHLIFTLCS